MKNQTVSHSKALKDFSSVPDYPAESIKKLIKRLEQTERTFAAIMNVSEYSVKLWITGAVRPCTTARRLMNLLDKHPEVIEMMFTAMEDA